MILVAQKHLSVFLSHFFTACSRKDKKSQYTNVWQQSPR